MLGVDENDDLIDPLAARKTDGIGFDQMVLYHLKTAGVQQAYKEDLITFTALTPWPGDLVCAEGPYTEGDAEKRAVILIGPEFAPCSGLIGWQPPARRATPASTR